MAAHRPDRFEQAERWFGRYWSAFVFAGNELGSNWHSAHDAFRYADYVAIAALPGALMAVVFTVRRRRVR